MNINALFSSKTVDFSGWSTATMMAVIKANGLMVPNIVSEGVVNDDIVKANSKLSPTDLSQLMVMLSGRKSAAKTSGFNMFAGIRPEVHSVEITPEAVSYHTLDGTTRVAYKKQAPVGTGQTVAGCARAVSACVYKVNGELNPVITKCVGLPDPAYAEGFGAAFLGGLTTTVRGSSLTEYVYEQLQNLPNATKPGAVASIALRCPVFNKVKPIEILAEGKWLEDLRDKSIVHIDGEYRFKNYSFKSVPRTFTWNVMKTFKEMSDTTLADDRGGQFARHCFLGKPIPQEWAKVLNTVIDLRLLGVDTQSGILDSSDAVYVQQVRSILKNNNIFGVASSHTGAIGMCSQNALALKKLDFLYCPDTVGMSLSKIPSQNAEEVLAIDRAISDKKDLYKVSKVCAYFPIHYIVLGGQHAEILTELSRAATFADFDTHKPVPRSKLNLPKSANLSSVGKIIGINCAPHCKVRGLVGPRSFRGPSLLCMTGQTLVASDFLTLYNQLMDFVVDCTFSIYMPSEARYQGSIIIPWTAKTDRLSLMSMLMDSGASQAQCEDILTEIEKNEGSAPINKVPVAVASSKPEEKKDDDGEVDDILK